MIFEKELNDKERALRLRYNQLLELAQVGDKPFDEEFYQTASLPRAIDQATNIAIIFSHHILQGQPLKEKSILWNVGSLLSL